MNVWSQCLQRLEQEYPAEDVHTWLKPLQASRHSDELQLLAERRRYDQAVTA